MHNLVNNLKTAGLLAALLALFLIVGYQFGTGGLIIGLIFGLVTNFGAWYFSDTIAIRAMQGREIGPDSGRIAGVDTRRIYESVVRLSQRAELPMPRVYLCPHDAPNAFATGRSPRKAAVAVTRGLASTTNDAELDGVIAHELAHIKYRDTLTSTIAATVAGVLAFVAQWFFFLGIGRREGGNPLVTILVVIGAAVGAALIKAMISRSREFAADAEGARIAGSPDGLASALARLDALSRRVPLRQPNPAQNNLFIVEPLAGGARSLTNLFATHPPTQQRIEALRRLG
ncbi:MAG: M48 family metalloprotease [bacterium]|nr:M48 family metalloprotease [bacterium]